MNQIRLLGISGSLRTGSANSGLLRAAQAVLPPGMTLTIHNLAALPLYNADSDGPAPPGPVRALKDAIAAADGLLIATPEYNYSVTGVLKNAIDWASRPPAESPLTGKPLAMMGAGGAMGTVRAQSHLRQIAQFNGMLTLAKPEVYVANVREKFDQAGNLKDEATLKAIRRLLEAFEAWIRRLGGDHDH
jgi:chromate reductase